MAFSMRAAASPWAPGKTAVMKSTVDDPAFQDTVKRAISGLPAQAVTEADTRRADMISLPIVFLLSPLIFGGLVAALVPPLLGMVAIVLSLAVPRIVSTFTDVATQGLMIVTMLGMGMAIDYSLFIISRFREELSGGHGRAAASEALARTLPTAGRTVLVSALVVAVALASLLVVPIGSARSMAYGAIAAVLGCELAAVTLLPASLAVLGQRINAGRVPGLRPRTADDDHGLWARIARHVMRRPWAYLVASCALLLTLALPCTGVRWGGLDEHLLPADAPSRTALTQQAKHFGGDTSWGYAMVTGADADALQSYAAQLAEVPGVRSVGPALATTDAGGGAVTTLRVTWSGLPRRTPRSRWSVTCGMCRCPPARHSSAVRRR